VGSAHVYLVLECLDCDLRHYLTTSPEASTVPVIKVGGGRFPGATISKSRGFRKRTACPVRWPSTVIRLCDYLLLSIISVCIECYVGLGSLLHNLVVNSNCRHNCRADVQLAWCTHTHVRFTPAVICLSHQPQRIMRQLLSGVAYLHANSILHRDLKPQVFVFDWCYVPCGLGSLRVLVGRPTKALGD
jgi:hypothetical protein